MTVMQVPGALLLPLIGVGGWLAGYALVPLDVLHQTPQFRRPALPKIVGGMG